MSGRLERCCNSAGVRLGGEDGDNVSPIVVDRLTQPNWPLFVFFLALSRYVGYSFALPQIPHVNPPKKTNHVPGKYSQSEKCASVVYV